MKRYFQTAFGTKPGQPDTGNCFATAIACILEMPPDVVPNFCHSTEWYRETNEWLNRLGFYYIDISCPEEVGGPKEILKYAGYHVISGKSPRGSAHSVVGYKGEFVHDPHPSQAGLLEYAEYGLVIPIDPALFVRAVVAAHPLGWI